MRDHDHIETLISQIALGQRSAFDSLYALTSAKLFGVCLRVLNNRAEAEDVLQEVFITIWQKSNRYAVTGNSPMTWLITIARNRSIDMLRKRRENAGPETLERLVDPALGPEQKLLQKGVKNQLDTCLDTLQDDKAGAVRAAYLQGESYQDLATHYNVPINTMRTWLRRSLLKIKECLSR